MTVPSRIAWVSMATAVLAGATASALDTPAVGVARNTSEMTLASFPGMPPSPTGAAQSGDPAPGPSIIYAKLAAGCVFPWHWHTPTETLMIVSGTAHAQM